MEQQRYCDVHASFARLVKREIIHKLKRPKDLTVMCEIEEYLFNIPHTLKVLYCFVAMSHIRPYKFFGCFFDNPDTPH